MNLINLILETLTTIVYSDFFLHYVRVNFNLINHENCYQLINEIERVRIKINYYQLINEIECIRIKIGKDLSII